MTLLTSDKLRVVFLILVGFIFPTMSYASGIMLGNTRIIYPLTQKQTSISVRNTSEDERFMVQSWIDDANEKKSSDFILTPPLFVSNPGQESALRLMLADSGLPTDRESLYYLTAKAIPAVDKEKLTGQNSLLIAAATRIKVFVRPDGLQPAVDKAPALLTFSRSGKHVTVSNPTPYYITMVNMKTNGKALENKSVMVSPKSSVTFSLPGGSQNLSFSTMNDYGGVSVEILKKL